MAAAVIRVDEDVEGSRVERAGHRNGYEQSQRQKNEISSVIRFLMLGCKATWWCEKQWARNIAMKEEGSIRSLSGGLQLPCI